MTNVNFIMQGKGGVGKSYVAWLLAQYAKEKDQNTVVIDTDPLTPTLSTYKSLDPKYIQIADQSEIHIQKFDEMMEIISETESDVIIDTGSSTFLPLSRYMLNGNILEMISEMGKQAKIHTVINAKTDNDLMTTIKCFDEIAIQFPEHADIIVWLNEFGGTIKTMDGLRFEDTKVYQDNKQRIAAIMTIPNPDELTLRDITTVQNSHITLSDAIGSPEFRLMAKSRLKRSRDNIYTQLDHCYGI